MAPAPGGGPATSSELICSCEDRRKNAGQILRKVVVPESKLGDAATAQPSGTFFIPNLLAAFAVLAAVKLDR
jgi:hypothetical protein